MTTYVILSDLDDSTPPIISSLAEQKEDLNLILLSDSVFLLNDLPSTFFKHLEDHGVNIYAIREDIDKRNPQNKNILTLIDYETLVDLLLAGQVRVISL